MTSNMTEASVALSVIIPFYKDYAFVEQAVHSVLMQQLESFEIVLVNDNPCTESQTFLSSLSFPACVRIITHETNRGLSAARNTGVANSKGEHIAYLDADDFYLADGLADQYRAALRSGCDITHTTTLQSEYAGEGSSYLAMLARDKQFFCQDIERTTIQQTPSAQFIVSSWKSIYRKQYLQTNQISFDEIQRKFEDRLYVLENVLAGGSICFVAAPNRIWRRRAGSITTSDKSHDDLIMMANLIDKCTARVERAVADRKVEGIALEREIFHSMSRLVWDTDLLEVAIGETATALEMRKSLVRALSRIPLEKAIFADPIIQQIDRTGIENKWGVRVDQSALIALHRSIVAEDWSEVKAIWQRAVAQRVIKPRKPSIPNVDFGRANALGEVDLTLHIGLHKTATTFLQHNFRRSRRALSERGYCFPETGFMVHAGTVAKADATPGHQRLMSAAIIGDRKVRNELVDEVIASGCTNVLISCENLSFPYLDQELRTERIAAFSKMMEGFRSTRIVAVLRRPDQYFEALYRERVTNPNMGLTQTAHDFLESNGDYMLDFRKMLSPWKTVTGGKLQLLSYEELKASPDYFLTFCEKIGLHGMSSTTTSGERTYRTPSREVIEVMRMVNALSEVGDRKIRVSRNFLNGAQKLASYSDQSALTIDARQSILQRVQQNSDAFLKENGLSLPFDKMVADLETEQATWAPIKVIDHDILQLMINVNRVETLWQDWNTRASAQSTLLGRARGVVARLASTGAVRIALMGVYRALPISWRELARNSYKRVTR